MRPPWTPLLLLLRLLLLLNVVPAVRPCLQCDRTVSLMHYNYILSLPDPIAQTAFLDIVNGGHDAFRETSRNHMGVIDLTTLYRVRTEYQSEFHRFTQTTTGLLVQRVVDCMTCRQRTYNCPSPTGLQDCGESRIEAEEGGQAMLDCFLPWHRLLIGKPEYHYSWVPASNEVLSPDWALHHWTSSTSYDQYLCVQKETRDTQTLVVTRNAFVVLNQLHVDDSGTYQCLLQSQTGTLFYKVTFIVSVTAVPKQIPKPPVPLPPPALESGHDKERREVLVTMVYVITALCLGASLGLAAVLRSVLLRRKEPASSRRMWKQPKTNTTLNELY